MRGLRKKIEDMMSAITFAEEGDFVTARSLAEPRKRVLLAIRNNRFDRKTCSYALNTSKRIGCGIDILVITNNEQEALSPAIAPLLEQLEQEKITYSASTKTGCLKQAILEHMAERDNVLFVVIDSQDSLNSNCLTKDKRLTDAWRQIQCPLVVVADGLKA